MYIGLKVSIAASIISLVAGIVAGYFVFSYNQQPVVEQVKVANTVYRKENKGDFTFEINSDDGDRISHLIDNMPLIEQLPELPTGCEVTSLTMTLKYLGLDVNKTEMANKYLIREALYRDSANKLHGPDFRYIFAGSPSDSNSYGCMAPCIVSTAKKYLDEKKADMSPIDLSGTVLDDLFDFIDQDIPVIIWSTMGLAAPEYKSSWIIPDGTEVTWPKNEHCVVMTGYDINANTVRIHDPVNGVIILNTDAVRERYEQLGSNAVVIVKNKKN